MLLCHSLVTTRRTDLSCTVCFIWLP
uniref:Uncharacterized protein n=1 Tax=Mesocestoides corti TaxID=53468 RepID=A0A5K3G338_MESCO